MNNGNSVIKMTAQIKLCTSFESFLHRSGRMWMLNPSMRYLNSQQNDKYTHTHTYMCASLLVQYHSTVGNNTDLCIQTIGLFVCVSVICTLWQSECQKAFQPFSFRRYQLGFSLVFQHSEKKTFETSCSFENKRRTKHLLELVVNWTLHQIISPDRYKTNLTGCVWLLNTNWWSLKIYSHALCMFLVYLFVRDLVVVVDSFVHLLCMYLMERVFVVGCFIFNLGINLNLICFSLFGTAFWNYDLDLFSIPFSMHHQWWFTMANVYIVFQPNTHRPCIH